jgi:hypothetical protein
MSASTEPWLRGPIPGIAPILQPLASALILAREDIEAIVPVTPVDILWTRANGAASAGFHVLHMAGALDRLFTYARGEMLTDAQKTAARAEAQEHTGMDGAALVALLVEQIERAMAQLRATPVESLLDERKVGRAGLPTTVMGALVHGAEHTARHAGQAVTTIKILAGG